MNKGDHKDKVVSIWRTPRLIVESVETQDRSDEVERRQVSAYNDARREGYAAGKEAADRENEANREMLLSYLKALAHPFDDQNGQLVEYIVTLAGKIAKSLVQKELSTDRESLMTIVSTAVSALGATTQEIKIHLLPDSADFIRAQISDDDEKACWQIIDDASLGLGDCKVSCENSTVNSSMNDRINLIIAQFFEEIREASHK